MRLEIKSDGTTVGTQITNVETGEKLGYVQKITWEVSVEDPVATCTVVIAKMPVEVLGVVEDIKELDARES